MVIVLNVCVEKISHLSKVKLQERIFVGLHIRKLMFDSIFYAKMSTKENETLEII